MTLSWEACQLSEAPNSLEVGDGCPETTLGYNYLGGCLLVLIANPPRQMRLTLECLMENSTNSPVSDLAPNKINPYVRPQVSTDFPIQHYMSPDIAGSSVPKSIYQKPLVYSRQAETHNSYSFYRFSLWSQIPLDSSSFLVTSLSLGLQRIISHPQARQINVPSSQGVCLV